MSVSKRSNQLQFFDYTKTKEKFKRLQLKYIQRKSTDIIKGTLDLWTREKVDICKDIILAYKKKNESYLFDERVSNYNVIKEDGVYKLVLRNKRYRGQHIEIVPFEDCFDKILAVHRSFGHNKNSKKYMYKILSKKYVIDKIWVFMIYHSCNLCISDVEELTVPERIVYDNDTFKRIYHIAFADINCGLEADYKYVMVVFDRKTQFLLLRPLLCKEPSHIALELVKIFADYGRAKMLETDDVRFFHSVVQLLKKFDEDFGVQVMRTKIKQALVTRVEVLLTDWLDLNETDNLVVACPIVQWQINNHHNRDNKSAYKEMFHMQPVRDLLMG